MSYIRDKMGEGELEREETKRGCRQPTNWSIYNTIIHKGLTGSTQYTELRNNEW